MSDGTASHGTSKRKRVEETPESPVPEQSTTRSDIWLEDGNIVIQAETTQFKVLRSLLVAHSSVFKDIFSIPQPPAEAGGTVEGCPVVHVSDSAVDVAIVLRALLFRGHVDTGLEALSIKIIAAFLRLGQKYEIELLRGEALKRLYGEYPLIWADYHRLTQHSLVADGGGVEIDVLNLAREQGILSVLPLALFECCRLHDAKPLVAGLSRDDGTISTLSRSDMGACLTAWDALSKLQSETTLAWIDEPPSTFIHCEHPERCTEVRSHAMRQVYYPCPHFIGLMDWIDFGEWGVENETDLDSMCSLCKTRAEELHERGRVRFWNGLPDAFCLPGWDELAKEREVPT